MYFARNTFRVGIPNPIGLLKYCVFFLMFTVFKIILKSTLLLEKNYF